MRRDDLQVIQPEVFLSLTPQQQGLVLAATRTVSRAEVLQAALTEECGDCLNGVEATPNGIGDPIATGSCRTCYGRGWVLIDGVRVRTELDDSARGYRETLVVPLSMLEGDDQ